MFKDKLVFAFVFSWNMKKKFILKPGADVRGYRQAEVSRCLKVGFSAGYTNTCVSKIGFKTSQFKSLRSSRAVLK